jgi:hypothetical protein
MPAEKLDLIHVKMKAMDKKELKKIAYNCKRATFLIEKQQFGSITLQQQLELKIHLAGCTVCICFMQQSIAINQMASKIFNASLDDHKLDSSFMRQLQQRIDDKFKGA